MTQVKMKAVDTLHISAVGPENIAPGEQFDIDEADAKQLEERGLAKRVGGAKAEKAAPENKMAAAPANKADKPPLSALGVSVKPAKKGK